MTGPRIVLFGGRRAGKTSALAALVKAHVDTFTRQDGTVVQAHDTKVQAAAPKYDHPNVVGHAEKLQGGDASKAHGMHFAGKEYSASGKTGNSFHDQTPVRHFRELTGNDDDGQHVWMDHGGRVHADDKSDVPKLRQSYEAHSAKSAPKPAAPAAGGAKSVGNGDGVYFPHPDKPGQKAMGKVTGHTPDGKAIVKHEHSDRSFHHAPGDLKVFKRAAKPSNDAPGYAARVAHHESKGMTTSDAQGAADAEAMQRKRT